MGMTLFVHKERTHKVLTVDSAFLCVADLHHVFEAL